jgi:hypothetical protein
MTKTLLKNIDLIGAIVSLSLGLLVIVAGVEINRRGDTTRSWPTTPGTILVSEVVTLKSKFEAVITYTYTIESHTYTSDRIYHRALPYYSEREQAQVLVAEFPPGQTVPIYYNPADPQYAVLVPGKTIEGTIFIVIGAVLLVFGLVGIAAFRSGKAAPG